MTFPTVREFATALENEPLEQIAQTYILDGTPYVFRDDQAAFDQLLDHLSTELSVAGTDIRVIGSARIGFSLDPTNFARPFGQASDLDIVVVSAELFDVVWHTTVRWHYPRRIGRLPRTDWEWSNRRRKELYWGWFRPEAIKYPERLQRLSMLRPLQELSTRWFNAFQSLSQYPALAPWEASGRLYQSWEHVLMYHVDGLRQLRDIVISAGGAGGVQ